MTTYHDAPTAARDLGPCILCRHPVLRGERVYLTHADERPMHRRCGEEKIAAALDRIVEGASAAPTVGDTDWIYDVLDGVRDIRTVAFQPARCGHSVCSQYYIDTGDASCVLEGSTR